MNKNINREINYCPPDKSKCVIKRLNITTELSDKCLSCKLKSIR